MNKNIKNLQGRSVRLDILAVDTNNRTYNIEIQRSDCDAGAKRARYNLTMCREMENMRKESSHKRAVEIAKRMLASGKLTLQDIADFSGLTIEELKILSTQKSA